MFRRIATAAAVVLFAASGLTACSKKLDCKAFASRVKKCKKEFASAAIDEAMKQKAKDMKSMSEDQKKQVRAMVEKQAGPLADMIVQSLSSDEFVKQCKKESSGKDAEELAGCMKKSGCKEFAACVMSKARK